MAEQFVRIPLSDYYLMKRAIQRIDKNLIAADMINEDEASKLLGIEKKTLRNKIHAGEMEGLFTISPVNSKRFYIKSKIMGLQ